MNHRVLAAGGLAVLVVLSASAAVSAQSEAEAPRTPWG